jgi:CRP/FNR family transcriptional regulator
MSNLAQVAGLELNIPACPALERLLLQADTIDIPPGTSVFHAPALRATFLWIRSGSVRVYKHSADGREITLYRMGADEPCFVCLNSMILGISTDTHGIAETEVRALAVTRENLEQAIERSPELSNYLLRIMTERLLEMATLAATTAFDKLDLRLACFLGRMFERSNNQPLRATHEDIARELGTSREVVSRILKQFEREGCIRLSRGAIELVAPEGLEAWTKSNS